MKNNGIVRIKRLNFLFSLHHKLNKLVNVQKLFIFASYCDETKFENLRVLRVKNIFYRLVTGFHTSPGMSQILQLRSDLKPFVKV